MVLCSDMCVWPSTLATGNVNLSNPFRNTEVMVIIFAKLVCVLFRLLCSKSSNVLLKVFWFVVVNVLSKNNPHVQLDQKTTTK